MTDIVHDLAASPDAVNAGRSALRAGAPILCDARMVAEGVTRSRLPADNVVRVYAAPSRRAGSCRSAWHYALGSSFRPVASVLGGAVVAIGNAPTALFRLLELLDEGAPKPALIVGVPVGFVGAAESKAALAANSRGVPFLTLHGRRGGSAIAAAAVNALAREEE